MTPAANRPIGAEPLGSQTRISTLGSTEVREAGEQRRVQAAVTNGYVPRLLLLCHGLQNKYSPTGITAAAFSHEAS